jgi:N4-gp56 family major capsid protein
MATGRKADYTDQIPQLWSADLYAQAENLTFWHNQEGPEGSSMPIIRKDDFEKQAGDTIKFDLVMALEGDGMTGDTDLLEGNEEKLRFRQESFTVDSLQHAVRWSKLGKILINHNMRTTALNQLSKWLAGQFDRRIFKEFVGEGDTTVPTQNIMYAGSATGVASLANTAGAGRLEWDSIMELKAYARAELNIEPLRMADGEEIFGLVADPYAILQLKRDDAKWAQAQREARARGADNPIFTGAVGIVDGVVLFENNNVRTGADGGAGGNIRYAKNVFFGAQALVRGYAYYPDWTEEYFSYGQEQGIATFTVYGQKLNVFDLTSAGGASAADKQGLGSLVFYTTAVGPSL